MDGEKLFKFLPTACHILDRNGIIIDVNDRWTDMFGFGSDKVKGTPFNDMADGMDDERFSELSRQLDEDGNLSDIELKVCRSDGEIIDCSADVIKVLDGSDWTCICTFRDITGMKKLQKDLKDSGDAYRKLYKNAPVGIYEVDLVNRKLLSCNDIILQTTGYTREEFLRLNPIDLLSEDSAIIFLERMYHVMKGEKVPDDIEYKIRLKDGSEIWVLLNTHYIYKDGALEKATVAVHNIDEMKRTEEELRRSEIKYRSVVDNAQEAIVIIQDDEIKYINSRTLEISGHTEEEMLSSNFLDHVHPDDRETVISRYRNRLNGDEITETYQFRVLKKNGEARWVELKAVMIFWEGKEATLNFLDDITERKQAVDALRESEMKFRELSDLLPQTVFELDLGGLITYTNRYGLESTGFSEEDLESGLHATNIFIPEDRQRLMDNVMSIMKGETASGNEYTLLKKDGSKTPVLTFSHPIIRDGKLLGLRGVLIDISDLKSSQEALRKSEVKFRTIVENSQIGMIILDSAFNIIYVNDRLCGQLDYQRNDLIGNDFRSFLDIETQKMMADRFIRRQRGEDVPQSYEFMVRRKDGEWRNYDIRSSVFTDSDGNTTTIAQMMDVTDRKQAMEALRESEMRSRAIFEFSPVGFVLSNHKTKEFIKVNRAFCDMLGYREEEILEKNVSEITHVDDIKPDNRSMNDLNKGTKDVMNREKRYIRKNGEIIWANTTGTLIKTSDGKPMYGLAVVEDITQKKISEQEIINQRNRAEFYLDLLSHDIGNIHQGLYNWIEIAQSAQIDPGKRDMAVNQTWHLVNRSMKLVKNVLLLANIRSRVAELEPIDIIPLIEKSLEDAVQIYPNRTLDHTITKPEGSVRVLAEPIIEEAFFNIIQNAIKFQVESDVQIELEVNMSPDGKQVIVSMKDHGPGITTDMKDEIFKRMKSERYNFRSGIGLYLVKELVDRYNGDIKVLDRVPGDHSKGARFDLIFDLAPDPDLS